MSSQGPVLTHIPQVHSDLAGHCIREAIHETGVLVALDLMLAWGGEEHVRDLYSAYFRAQ